MTGSKGREDLEGIRNLESAIVERLSALPEAELLAELAEDGIDADADAERVLVLSLNAAARARMAAAKAGVAIHRSRSGRLALRPANDPHEARGLTMAARNGASQSETDVNSVAEDLALLASLEAEKAGK